MVFSMGGKNPLVGIIVNSLTKREVEMPKKSIYDKPWSVYIAQCADKTLYSGVALDVTARIHEHNHTNKCRYTRCRKPVRAVYKEECPDYSSALKREIALKRLDRKEKLELIKSFRCVPSNVGAGPCACPIPPKKQKVI